MVVKLYAHKELIESMLLYALKRFLFDMYVCTIWLEDVIGKWILIEWSLLGHKGPLEVSDNFGQGSSKSEEQCWLNYVIPTPNSS